MLLQLGQRPCCACASARVAVVSRPSEPHRARWRAHPHLWHLPPSLKRALPRVVYRRAVAEGVGVLPRGRLVLARNVLNTLASIWVGGQLPFVGDSSLRRRNCGTNFWTTPW